MDDQSYSESDISSPSQILQRLQVLRQLQLLQRGKLHKQQLHYEETTETSSSITEIVSHFSNSTSYNTFRSLLQSAHDPSQETSPRLINSDLTPKVQTRDLVDGVSILNLSQESEYVINSPNSDWSKATVNSKSQNENPQVNCDEQLYKEISKKHIALDDMPIISPKKDFEALVLEKIQNDKGMLKPKITKNDNHFKSFHKKPFLRKGEGMSRFGLRQKDLVIQNTKSLPWRKTNQSNKNVHPPKKSNSKIKGNFTKEIEIPVAIAEPKVTKPKTSPLSQCDVHVKNKPLEETSGNNKEKGTKGNYSFSDSNYSPDFKKDKQIVTQNEVKLQKGKHPLLLNKGKTWAAILTKEQNDFLTQLKQSDYYKNFTSPAKSEQSDISYDNLATLCQERERAEQNMFDLLENKIADGSLENSFYRKFMARNKLECSGESTPIIMQKCLANNPQLLSIVPDLNRERTDSITSEPQTCQSDCCSDMCTSVSTCCSCETIETVNNAQENYISNKTKKVSQSIVKVNKEKEDVNDSPNKNDSDTVFESDIIKTNMVEMNAKLIATSNLLKDRLQELEVEIDTFRKENANLSKMREDIDLERQKFYEEKAMFEQKFNEEKVLSEYYLSEEKDKLIKQKQMYERYVREIRGRLNKKEKDEVVNLKKEIEKLKEEIRIKDAKSTSSLARLRNQIKIMEKEKKDLKDEIEKLKKDNRRIQHSNDMTRRLTNMKYLEEINKKLSNMASKETRSEISLDNDIKYKSYEIERQSRSRNVKPNIKGNTRPRAKSVPNLKVTSRYAKYFSQRDSVSNIERHKNISVEKLTTESHAPNSDELEQNDDFLNFDDYNSEPDKTLSDNENENNLEKMYKETFKSISPTSNRSSLRNSNEGISHFRTGCISEDKSNTFFLQKNSSSDSLKDSMLPYFNTLKLNPDISKSPISILPNKSQQPTTSMPLNAIENMSNNYHKQSTSPISVLSNSSKRHSTVIHNENYRDQLLTVSPEPIASKSSLIKTNLNPTEIKKPDGSKELRFPNGNVKHISADGKYSKFIYYNGDVKENFYNEGRIKYFYAETKTFHTTHPDGLEVLEFPE